MAIVKEGYIEKQGPTLFTPIRKRYLVLYTTRVLEYFKDETRRELCGQITLDDHCTVRLGDKGKSYFYGFYVNTPSRLWKFAVENPSDRNEWQKCIEDVLSGKMPIRQRRNKSAPAIDISGLQVPRYKKKRSSNEFVEPNERDRRNRNSQDEVKSESESIVQHHSDRGQRAATIDVLARPELIPKNSRGSNNNNRLSAETDRDYSLSLMTMNTMNTFQQLPRKLLLSIIAFCWDDWKDRCRLPLTCRWVRALCLHPAFYANYEVIPHFDSTLGQFDPHRRLRRNLILSHNHNQIWTFGNLAAEDMSFLAGRSMEDSDSDGDTAARLALPVQPRLHMISLLRHVRRWGFDDLDLWNWSEEDRARVTTFLDAHRQSMIEIRIRTQVSNPVIPFKLFSTNGLSRTRSLICEFSWHYNTLKNMFGLVSRKSPRHAASSSPLLKLCLYRVNLYDDISLQHDTTFQNCLPAAKNLLVLGIEGCRWNGKLQLPPGIELLKFGPTDKAAIDCNTFMQHSRVPVLHVLVNHSHWPKVLKKKLIGGSKALSSGRLAAWATNFGSSSRGEHYKNVNFCENVPVFREFENCLRVEELRFLEDNTDMSDFWWAGGRQFRNSFG